MLSEMTQCPPPIPGRGLINFPRLGRQGESAINTQGLGEA